MKPKPNPAEFELIVKNAADTKSSVILPNSSVEKAVIVLANIFRTSEKSIKIFANKLESPICKDSRYIDALRKAVVEKENLKLQVLFYDNPEKTSPTYKMLDDLCFKYPGKVEMKTLSPQKKDELDNKKINSGKKFRFAVADDRMYRFENNNDTFEALFCFNDPTRSLALEKLFDNAFK